jgi:hypothetical protein
VPAAVLSDHELQLGDAPVLRLVAAAWSASIGSEMQLFLVAFQQPIPFGISVAVVTVMIGIIFKAALSSEGGARWVRRITNPNAKFLFTFLFIGWAVVFGIGLQLVPHVGASTPYGGLGLIALFSGFFIMMGLLWAVIGE